MKKAVTIAKSGLSFKIVEKSGLFPPLDILNAFLNYGIDDAASEISINWEPFALTQCEYDEFVKQCRSFIGDFRIDSLGMTDYASWFSTAALEAQ